MTVDRGEGVAANEDEWTQAWDAPTAALGMTALTPAAPDETADRVRVAILSDTHGWVDPRVLAVVAGCDLAVHGGDVGNALVLTQLRPRLGVVWAVRGNNDSPAKWPTADQDVAAGLPEQIEVPLPGGSLLAIHGHRTSAKARHDRLRRRFPQVRALVYGHSHQLVLDQSAMPWIINPGAAGRDRTHGGPSCLVLIADNDSWQFEVHRFPLRPRR